MEFSACSVVAPQLLTPKIYSHPRVIYLSTWIQGWFSGWLVGWLAHVLASLKVTTI